MSQACPVDRDMSQNHTDWMRWLDILDIVENNMYMSWARQNILNSIGKIICPNIFVFLWFSNMSMTWVTCPHPISDTFIPLQYLELENLPKNIMKINKKPLTHVFFTKIWQTSNEMSNWEIEIHNDVILLLDVWRTFMLDAWNSKYLPNIHQIHDSVACF